MAEPTDKRELARRVLESEGRAILALIDRLDDAFVRAVDLIFACPGSVVLTGIGKAGLIARKISATFASTGTRSIFLHPVEALHGDLGRLARGDVVVALSHSGQTEEIIRLLDHVRARGAQLVALTSSPGSALSRHADVTITYGQVEEACPHGLAPSVSTSCMLALGDALALTVMAMRQFDPEDFAAFHPAGALGMRVLKVSEVMTFRPGERLMLVSDGLTLRDALIEADRAGRRSGAMVLVDESGKLSGILTDADIRRSLVDHGGTEGDLFEVPVSELMIRDPKRIHQDALAADALAILNQMRIDELPVVDDDDRPVGIIDVQDLLGIKTVSDDGD
ncbi:MAG: KpsF/GutQ family sugar-phosphate isomerase [Planctomycetota bacterium]|jgi:arabinose-5-phosphate isomerase